jgi:hypothetical protein
MSYKGPYNGHIIIKDKLREAVESATGGRQTIIYTAKGQPSWMYVLPKFNMEDIPGWTAGTGTHPAFIANGAEQSEIMVGVYQAAEIDGEAVSRGCIRASVSTTTKHAHCAKPMALGMI